MRAASLLVLGPLLLLALTIARPGPFPASTLPPSFDGPSAVALATELALNYPSRQPGSGGAAGAAQWVKDKLGALRPHRRRGQLGREHPRVSAASGSRTSSRSCRGSTDDAILVLAHRDDTGVGPGANDNASGTAALIELARGYGRLGTVAGRPTPQHTLIFLSSDGGAYGGFGAERFASTSPYRDRIKAVVSLDGLAGSARPRLELAGFEPRSPAPALIRTADVQVAAQLGRAPARAGWLVQLVDLGMPFGYGEQAPFLGRKISAIRLATAPDNDAGAAIDTPGRLNSTRFLRLGRASESILASLDGGIELAGGTAGHVYLGSRIIRGWAIELVLLTALVPFLVGAIDLFARSRRRRLPLRGGWRALRTRFGVWLWIGLLVGLGALAGVFPRGSAIPPPPGSAAVSDWPVAGLAVLGLLAALGWLRARRVLVPVAPAGDDDVLAGYAVSLVALGGVADRDRADQPVRPAVRRPVALRLAVAAAGGAALVVGSRRPLRRRARRAGAGSCRDRHPARARARRAALPRLADDPRVHPLDDRARAARLGRDRVPARRARGRPLPGGAAASADARLPSPGRR